MKIEDTDNLKMTAPKILIYGQSGVGKTSLAKTMPKPLVVSSERGLLPLRGSNINFVNVNSFSELISVFLWLGSEGKGKFMSVMVDSLSDLADKFLAAELKRMPHALQAYGLVATATLAAMDAIQECDLPTIIIGKIEEIKDELGTMTYGPRYPGKVLCKEIPYRVDFVLPLRFCQNSDGQKIRVLQCQSDGIWLAKDRSGLLALYERPDIILMLTKLQNKNRNEDQNKDQNKDQNNNQTTSKKDK